MSLPKEPREQMINMMYLVLMALLAMNVSATLLRAFRLVDMSLEEANFILCTGFLEGHEDSLDFYKNLLKNHIQLKLICTNPDLIVCRGSKQEYCAGTLAVIFQILGG